MHLADDHETAQVTLQSRAELRDLLHRVEVSRLAEPEERDAVERHEWEAELGGDGRLGQRLRQRDAVRVDRLLLGSSPHHLDVRER